jgi:hypothetical protein
VAREFKVGIVAPPGTAVDPTFKFVNYPNTGIYASAPNEIAFSVSSTMRAFLDASGFKSQFNVSHQHGTARSTAMMDLEVLTWMS